MFLYYCNKHTDIVHQLIANYVGIDNSNITKCTGFIQDDIDAGYNPTLKMLKEIKNAIPKTNI